MSASAVTLLAASIAALVSLTIALLNNYFTRRLKEDEYKQRRQEIFLDKELKDAEEIVAFFDEASKEFIDTFSNVLAKVQSVRYGTYSPEDYTVEALAPTFNHLNKLRFKNELWFAHRARQLSSLFAESETIYEELKDMGIYVWEVYDPLTNMLASVQGAVSERSRYSDEEFRASVEQDMQYLFEVRDRQLRIIADTQANYRKRLFGSLRVSPFVEEKHDESLRQDDGLLVKSTRWLERKLRDILRLR